MVREQFQKELETPEQAVLPCVPWGEYPMAMPRVQAQYC